MFVVNKKWIKESEAIKSNDDENLSGDYLVAQSVAVNAGKKWISSFKLLAQKDTKLMFLDDISMLRQWEQKHNEQNRRNFRLRNFKGISKI